MSDTAAGMADSKWQREQARKERRKANGAATGDALVLKYWRDLDVVAPPDRLVRRLLGTTAMALMFGDPGSGKSFLAFDLALHIALGRPWFGRPVTPGAAIYVAAEGSTGLSNRSKAARLSHGLTDELPFVVIPAAVDLGPDGRDAERIVAAAEVVETHTGQMVQIIVIDTLARAMGSGDENATADMGKFIAACDKIRVETGATVLIVHHKGKSPGAGARGNTALMGAVDTAIEVEKLEGGRVAQVRKQKDGGDEEKLGFILDVVEIGRDDDGEPITSCVVRPTDEVAKRSPRLSPAEKRAVDVLRNVLIDFGERPPNSVTFPAVTLVKIEHFRTALKSAGVTDRDNSQNERQQWRRITTSLGNKGVFVMRDDYCWLA